MLPLEILSAESAILENATSMLALFAYVASKAREVKRFRADCAVLSNTCVSLYLTFLQQRSSLAPTQLRNELWRCIQDTSLLVLECLNWNIAHVAFDVVVSQNLNRSRPDWTTLVKLLAWRSCLVTDVNTKMTLKGDSTETTTALKSLMTQLGEIQNTQGSESADLKELLGKFQQLQVDTIAIKKGVQSLRPNEHAEPEVVSITGSDFSVTERGADGKPVRGAYGGNPVFYQEILRSNNISDGLPRIVKLYRDMTDVAQIQRLYAIVEENGTFFAVMDDIGRHTRLTEALMDGKTSNMTRIQKLQIAYELAATVAALHRANIVIKVLSDTTVYLETLQDGYIRPVLSELSHARMIWETTSRELQDPRFDAPETEPAGQRSTMSDVWGLGILLRMVLAGGFPYDISSTSLRKDDDEQRRAVKTLLRSGQLPFTPPSDAASVELKLAQKCLHMDPFLRPTSNWLAEQLYELVIRAGVAEFSSSSPAGTLVASGPASIHDSPDEALKLLASLAEKARNHLQDATKVSIKDLDALRKASQSANPVCAYALGHAYMHNLIEMESESDNGTFRIVPEKVRQAQAAIPYLEIAEQQGHVGAIKQLVRAHKVRAEHYLRTLQLDSD